MIRCLFLEGYHKTKQNPIFLGGGYRNLYPKGHPRVAGGGQGGVHHLGHLARHGTCDNSPKDGGAAPWQILDVTLLRRFPLTPNEFRPEASTIGSSLKLSFHSYKERPKQTPYATWTSFLVRAAPGLRGGLELE